MNITAIILIVKKLLKSNDIKDSQIIETMQFLKQLDIESLFFYDKTNCNYCKDCISDYCCYYSPMESYLVNITKIGYPIGYMEEIISKILIDVVNNYTIDFIETLNIFQRNNRQDRLVLEYWTINNKVSSISNNEVEVIGNKQVKQYLTEIIECNTSEINLDLFMVYTGEMGVIEW